MLKLTQSNLDPGNCWQTAVACLLEVDPETLPPQVEIESRARREGEQFGGHYSYGNALGCYLKKHHDRAYTTVFPWQLAQCRIVGEHMMSGPTVRMPVNRSNHVVCGVDGEFAWAVHPSRAGLTKVERIEFIIPYPSDWKEREPKLIAADLQRWRERAQLPADQRGIMSLCCCPACFVDGEYVQ